MTTEEKAKAYDEALERARVKRDEYKRLDGPKSYVPQDIEEIFPELADSEDKRIIRLLRELGSLDAAKELYEEFNLSYTDILYWLEKQKEQKPLSTEETELNSIAFLEQLGYTCVPPGVEQKSIRDITSIDAIESCMLRYLQSAANRKDDIEIIEDTKAYKSELISIIKKEQKPAEKHDLVAQLKEHLANTPKKQLEAEWKELEKWNDVGPTVEEYLRSIKPAECDEEGRKIMEECEYDKETITQKAYREGQNAGRQEVFDNPGAYGLEKINNVFGFRIGDKVRLVDGDGRFHIIKYFEKIEGLHGPDFYRAVFEDNMASDHIIPGDGFPNGYFTRMEKIDGQKEQNPAEWKSAEWSKNDTVFLKEIIDFFENKTIKLQHDMDMYAHWLKSLPERFNLQPKEEWSEKDKQDFDDLVVRFGKSLKSNRCYFTSYDVDWLKLKFNGYSCK